MPSKELTILMPCLNEALTIGTCINRARKLLAENGIDGEILISDNGSTDGSQAIARSLGARAVDCPVRGYGAALQHGIEHAEGEFTLMGDSDDSYHFEEAFPMIEKLREGLDVCMGTRLRGEIKPGAMPFMNRHLGNPALTYIGQKLFRIPTTDFHCGMRAFRTDKVRGIKLVTTGMEWASEMVIQSRLNGLKMAEVPITLHKDGRDRPPHLRKWRDGWRHLRFMLLHAPNWLFVLPGMILVTLGMLGESVLIPGMVRVGKAALDVHTMLVLAFMMIAGVQMLFTGALANVYSHTNGILPYTEKYLESLKGLSLEKLLLMALVVGGAGGLGFAGVIWKWYQTGFGALDVSATMRLLIPSMTLLSIAGQAVLNGFMLSVLFLPTRSSLNLYEQSAGVPASSHKTAQEVVA